MSPEEIRNKVKDVYAIQPGITNAEAVKLIGVSERTLTKYKIELGIVFERSKWTSEELQTLRDMIQQEVRPKVIAASLGRTVASVQQAIHRARLADKKPGVKANQDKKPKVTIPATELFEKTKTNRLITQQWSVANIQEIYQ